MTLGVVLLVSSAAASPNRVVPVADSQLAGTTLLIIRHAEKPEEGSQLTPAGYRRADAYVDYFRRFSLDGKRLHLDHIFAAADSKNSQRPRLTVEPLSHALHMPIDQRFKSGSYQDLVDDLKAHHYGSSILICWHHGKIPELLNALGADAARLIPSGSWPGGTYDWVVEVAFDKDGHVSPNKTRLIHEHLMPGDAP